MLRVPGSKASLKVYRNGTPKTIVVTLTERSDSETSTSQQAKADETPAPPKADALDGVRIHSVRLPGLVAHEEIHFGGPGEGLTIRHDSFERSSFVQGVALAIRALDSTPRFLDGIGSLVG